LSIFTTAMPVRQELSLASQRAQPLKPAPEPMLACTVMIGQSTRQSIRLGSALTYPQIIIPVFILEFLEMPLFRDYF
jgi:hypothetical protein